MLKRIRDRFGGLFGKKDDRRGGARRRRGRRARAPRETPVVDVISQVACAWRHKKAALLGAAIGGAVPWFGRTLAHAEMPQAWADGRTGLALAMLVVVLGCCAFSLSTVHKFGRAAFGEPAKATWFVVALEGVMLVSRGAPSLWALGVLIAINGVANGCVIALSHEATLKRREADARRSQTRAQTRDRRRGAEDAARRPQPAAPVTAARAPSPAAAPEPPVVVLRVPPPALRSPRSSNSPVPLVRPTRSPRPASPGVAIVRSARRPWDDEATLVS